MKLSLSVSGDALGAKIRMDGFTPEDWKNEWAGASGRDAPDRLRAFLAEKGIAARCIRGDILEWIGNVLGNSDVTMAAKDAEAVEGVDVAQGQYPIHEEPQELVFHHSYLSNAEAIADLRRKADAWGYNGIRESIDPSFWVIAGATVYSFQGFTEGLPGTDVFGMPIPFLTLRDRLPGFGKSLSLQDKKVIAICEGVLIIENGQLKVLGSDSLPTCQVVVGDDKMSANLVLGGNYMNDWVVNLDMVQSALREQGVLCMLPEAEVQAALNRFNHDYQPLTLLVSRGRPPVPGENGRLVIMVDPEPDVPEPGPDGSVDFKSFTFFRTVKKGVKLAQVIPPTPGEAGMDVHGRKIPPPEGKSFAENLGKNTALEGVDPLYIVAATAGRLAVRGGIPEVVEVLDVDGDVSLKTGNIEFPGAVMVKGDVHGKMVIQAVGDVEIAGTVEDSTIRSDGAIVIKGGVNGMGNGIIKSRLSSVTIGYLHNQRIESHSNIVVFNEIINSHLLARKSISMRYGKYSVLGGHLLAGETMDLFNVGSEAGSRTVLEVGKDFEVEAEIADKNAKLLADMQDLEFLRSMDDQLTGIMRLRRSPADEDVILQRRIHGAMEVLQRWINELKKKLEDLSKRLYTPGTCVILVRGTAFPGTILKYRDHVLALPAEVSHRRWIFRDHGAAPMTEGQDMH